MAWTMLLGFVAFSLSFSWLLMLRVRNARAEEWLETVGLDTALAERRAEGAGKSGRPDESPALAGHGFGSTSRGGNRAPVAGDELRWRAISAGGGR
jgi:hypothetical protein